MLIGQRLRSLRKAKKLSQRDVERRSGLLNVHISKIENGHIVPSIVTLERLARALDVPVQQLLDDKGGPAEFPKSSSPRKTPGLVFPTTHEGARFLDKLRRLSGRIDKRHRELLLFLAEKMANR